LIQLCTIQRGAGCGNGDSRGCAHASTWRIEHSAIQTQNGDTVASLRREYFIFFVVCWYKIGVLLDGENCRPGVVSTSEEETVYDKIINRLSKGIFVVL
jgi:hypothetical protein